MENEFNSNVERTEEYQYLNWIFGGFESPQASLELFNPESKRSSPSPCIDLQNLHLDVWRRTRVFTTEDDGKRHKYTVRKLLLLYLVYHKSLKELKTDKVRPPSKRINIFRRTSTFQLF